MFLGEIVPSFEKRLSNHAGPGVVEMESTKDPSWSLGIIVSGHS